MSMSICPLTHSRYDTLLQEKEYLQEAYDSLQQDLSAMESESHSTRELRMLKKLTQTLEVHHDLYNSDI